MSSVTAKNCRSIPTSRSTIGTTGVKSGCVRKNSFSSGFLLTVIDTMPTALVPLTPGRSFLSFLNSTSSSSSSSATIANLGLEGSSAMIGLHLKRNWPRHFRSPAVRVRARLMVSGGGLVLLVMGNVAADELAAERHRGAQHNETAAGTDGFALRRRLRALAPF